ncbi:MAG: hypothetical protein GXP25_13220 [Planctomycetes bacterium]|nr:hypothetical protein [Planctomycetota bacterium]
MKPHVFLAAVLLCLGPVRLSGQEKPRPTLGSVLRDGRAAMAAGKPSQACTIYRQGADQIDGYARQIILRELARVLIRMNKGDEAIAIYEKLLAQQQAPYERQRTLGELAGALDSMGRYDKAIKTYQTLMGEYTLRDRRRYEILGSILRVAHQAGKAKAYMDKVRADLKEALQQGLDENDRKELIWRTRLQLGDSCFLMKSLEEAAEDYKAALSHAPESAHYRIHKKLLLCYEQLKDYQGVIRECSALMAKTDPRTGSPYARKLAQAYFMVGKDADGMEAMANADPYTVASIAESMTTAGDFDSSEKILTRGIERSPDNTRLLCALARLNWCRDRCDKAIEIYRMCYARTSPSDSIFFKIAENISSVYIDKKDIDVAAAAERRHLDEMKARKGQDAPKQDDLIRSLLLTALMEHDADDYSNALRHLMELEPMATGRSRLSIRVRNQIIKTALAAVSDLLARGQVDEAERALTVLNDKRYRSLACEYAEYVILDRKGKTREAAEKLRNIRGKQPSSTTLRLGPRGRAMRSRRAPERSHWTAATFLARIGMMDLAVEEWKRTIESSPHNTNADKIAAVCLGEYYADRGMNRDALKWFEKARNALDQGISPRYSAYWRLRELRVRLDLAGGDPDVAAAFLKDGAFSYRIAAMHLLKDVGTPSHIPLIETAAKYLPADLRNAADAAVLAIKSRFLRQFQMGLATFDEKKLRDTFARKTSLLWIKPDGADPSLRWIGVKDGFALLADLKHQALYDFSDSLGLLDDSLPTPTCIAFSDKAVWVGTNRGAFAYDRASRKWSQYAIMGKFLDIPIEKIEHSGANWTLTVPGKGRFLFAAKDRSWRKLPE